MLMSNWLFIILWYATLIILAIVGARTLVHGIKRKEEKETQRGILFLLLPAIVVGITMFVFLKVLVIKDLM